MKVFYRENCYDNKNLLKSKLQLQIYFNLFEFDQFEDNFRPGAFLRSTKEDEPNQHSIKWTAIEIYETYNSNEETDRIFAVMGS